MPSRLEDLELLVAVVEHGTFSSAASHAGTSQSRVSRAIARLEEGLGLVLVRRSPRSVSVTAEGRRLAEHARRLLTELSDVEADLRRGDGMTGPIAISTPPSLGRRLLASALASFCEQNPGVQLDWSLGARRVDLISEEVDLAVRFAPLAPTWQRARRLVAGAYHVYAAPGVADGAALPAALSELPCLGLHVTHRRDRWPFRVDGEVELVDVEPAHWADDVDALIGLAVAGLGLALLPDFLVVKEVERGELVRLTGADDAVSAEVFVNLGYQQPTARARALVDHLLRTVVAPAKTAAFETVVDLGTRRERWVLPTLATLSDAAFQSVSLDGEAPRSDAARAGRSERYEDLGPIGVGGMGEVRRVRDRELNRTLAMKTLHARLAARPRALARFVEEAQATSQLQHPNIIPIHDIGLHPDGTVWFTMREVRGRTLSEVIAEVHAASGREWEPSANGWTFRQLVAAFLQVCRAVGYAHERGVVHRDLKPDNVMVGDHGEVYVVDWGLAKVLGRVDLTVDDLHPVSVDAVVTDRAQSGSLATRVGSVTGTPVYMSPEQATGQTHRIDARSDVYGLGAMLYEVLSGDVPFHGTEVMEVLGRVAAGQVRSLPSDDKVPGELVEVCERAMAFEPEARFGSAAELADEVQAWLDGARRREQARAVVDAAVAHGPEAERLRARAAELDQEAEQVLSRVATWQPEQLKVPGWSLRDEAAELRMSADREELMVEQGLHGALRIDPTTPRAHAALAERHLAEHEQAELRRDRDGVARSEALMAEHVRALPEGHPVRTRCAAYLKGDGALTLVTDPPGAEVELHRFVQRNRRLVAEPERSLGRTPITAMPLEMGSWLCVIRHPESPHAVRYPVHIGRGEHWDGVPPGGREPEPVRLPGPGDLDPGDQLVPAGWFSCGGDPKATDSVPRARLWCHSTVFQRFPVTHREYIAFLDDLVSRGLEQDALAWAPRERAGTGGEGGALCYQRDDEGRFVLVPDADGDVWDLDWPVFNVHWGCAVAYARWYAARTGRDWRLPGELEWEKAARGVDGRWFPWGDYLDASWACMRDSHSGQPLPAVVDSFPIDESVYGVRGMGGNMNEWCADRWVREGPETPGDRVPVPVLPEEPDLSPTAARTYRGGYWNGFPRFLRCAYRWNFLPTYRNPSIGFRLARSLGTKRR